MGSSIFCGVAQIAVHRSHKPGGGGASPPATSNLFVVSTGVRPGLISSGELPDQRQRLGSTPRTTTNQRPWPEGFRGRRYERRSRRLDSCHGRQFTLEAVEFVVDSGQRCFRCGGDLTIVSVGIVHKAAWLHSDRAPQTPACGTQASPLRRVIAAVRFGLGVPIWDAASKEAVEGV